MTEKHLASLLGARPVAMFPVLFLANYSTWLPKDADECQLLLRSLTLMRMGLSDYHSS